jgi:hypothetical protein
MATSEQEIVRKTINWCKSVKKNISKFSYELEEDYDGDHEYEIHQAQMSIDYASVQLQDIENNYDSLDSISDFNNQIVSAAESLDEAIEYLEGCNDDMF